MVKEELQRFARYDDRYGDMCAGVFEAVCIGERTVAAITSCGTRTGTLFLSRNFTRVFGCPRKLFMAGDLQFLIQRIHPEDLPAFVHFAEKSTLNASAWKDVKEKAVHELYSRVQHGDGKWLWIRQRVVVLSVTPDRHIENVLLLFDDCTDAKEAEFRRHASEVQKGRRNSKLLDLLYPVSSAQAKSGCTLMPAPSTDCLTRREKEVLKLVSQGLSSKEISAALYISRHTVESHRKHILHKLQVRNAPAMVHRADMASTG